MSEDADIAGLRSKVAKGAGWVGAARIAIRVLGFINTIVVARLLTPEDFGIIAIGVTTMQLLQGFSDVGVSQAIVRFHDADRKDVDTLFTFSVIRGLLVAALLIAIAPFAAGFYGDERVQAVFFAVALFPLMIGFINPKFFEYERDLDFSKDFLVTVTNKLAGVAVSITIALIFRTYWAIILGLLTGGLVQLILSYALRPYRPRFTFASFNKMFGFSSWLAGVSFMAALNNKLNALIVARFASPTDAGNFYMGAQLSELATNEISQPVTRALYPGFSSLQEQTGKMRLAYLQGVEALGMIVIPIAFGFSFVAQDLVIVLLGAKWSSAIPVIEIIAPVMGLQTLFLATQSYAIARNMTKFVFYREFFFFFIRTPIIVYATLTNGLMGATYAFAAMGLLHLGLNLALYARLAGDPFWRPLWSARRSLAGAAALSLYFLFLRPSLGLMDTASTPINLIVNIAVGAALYLGVVYTMWRLENRPDGIERILLTTLRTRLDNKRPASSP
ncbi:MAG: lipopolysaccharide biosynthesis protein [Pseudomonadota bacterium]